jgi:hypothetical protein
MKIGKQVKLELPRSKHTPGTLTTFGRPCPEVPQHEPTTACPIQSHKIMAGAGGVKPQRSAS